MVSILRAQQFQQLNTSLSSTKSICDVAKLDFFFYFWHSVEIFKEKKSLRLAEKNDHKL